MRMDLARGDGQGEGRRKAWLVVEDGGRRDFVVGEVPPSRNASTRRVRGGWLAVNGGELART